MEFKLGQICQTTGTSGTQQTPLIMGSVALLENTVLHAALFLSSNVMES